MAKFLFAELATDHNAFTTRLGAGTGGANNIDDKEVGKFVKYVGESRYDLCSAGNPIEGVIVAVEAATADGYSIGSVNAEGRITVTFDGLQATPGTGSVAVGDYVVCGTVVAKGTALSGPAKVCKATNQPGATVAADTAGADTAAAVDVVLDAALAKVCEAQKNSLFAWRVVSLGSAGTGAAGTTGLIERVNA